MGLDTILFNLVYLISYALLIQKITRRTTGARGCNFLTSLEQF